MTSPAPLHRQLSELLARGQLPGAMALLQAHPADTLSDPADLAWAARTCMLARAGEQACLYARHALEQDPELSARLMSALALARHGAVSEAADAVADLSPAEWTDAQACDQLGHVLTACEYHTDAHAAFVRAVELAPNMAQAQFNLGANLRFRGHLDEAARAFDRAIVLDPGHFEAHFARSGLKRQTRTANHIDTLQDLLQGQPLPVQGQVQLGYALAKELEDLERWDEAFKAYARAASAMKNASRYTVDSELATLGAIRQHQTARSLPALPAETGELTPVFILGLPRAGSTLLERMLAARPDISTAGELDDLARAIVTATPQPTSDMARASVTADKMRIADIYTAALKERGHSSGLVIDKMPLNFLYVGLILSSLPGARVIHVHRQPMDALFSTYKMLFAGRYLWSYNLADAAAYIAEYQRLMTHWEQEYPGRIHHLAYEDLVTDPETALTRILSRLDLNWDAACLDFHTSRAASTTASASQIREPLHGRAIGHWRNFETYLEPYRAALETSAETS